jgi:hypothetical protein
MTDVAKMSPLKSKKKRLGLPYSVDIYLPFHCRRLSMFSTSPKPMPTEPRLQIQTPTRTPNNATIYISIATQFATISTRELSFHDCPHTNITPQQMARLGVLSQSL